MSQQQFESDLFGKGKYAKKIKSYSNSVYDAYDEGRNIDDVGLDKRAQGNSENLSEDADEEKNEAGVPDIEETITNLRQEMTKQDKEKHRVQSEDGNEDDIDVDYDDEYDDDYDDEYDDDEYTE